MDTQIAPFFQHGYNGKLGFELPDTEEQLFQICDLPVLDTDAFRKIWLADDWEVMLTQALNIFLEISPKETALIESAHNAHDWQQVEKLAHKMKGGCSYGGLQKLAIACQFLERYIKAGHSQQNEKLYEQMIQTIEETIQEVESWVTHHH